MDGDPVLWASLHDVTHHAIDVDVGENWAFNGALADSTSHFEPLAKAIFRPYPTTSVGIHIAKKLDKLLWKTPAAERSPQSPSRYPVDALL